jgi:hypothetical protein
MCRNVIILVMPFLFITSTFAQTEIRISANRKGDLKDILFKVEEIPLNLDKELDNIKQNRNGCQRSIPLETTPYWTSQFYDLSIWGVALADITNDGYPEVITIYEQGYNYLYLNNNGIIESTPSWQSNDWDYHVWPAFGDYDNDGDLDMAVACYSVAGGRTKLYRNDNGMLDRDPIWTASSGGGTWCDWGDIDNDGDLDLAIVDMFGYPGVFKNNNGNLEQSPSWRAIDYNIDFGGAWIDYDNDGDLDLAVTGINWQEPVLRIYKNTNGTLEQIASWTSQLDPNYYCGGHVSAGDIDKNGTLDLAATMGWMEDHENCVYGDIINYQIPSWYSDDFAPSTGSVLGDLNGDGWLDWAFNNQYGTSAPCPAAVYQNENGIFNPVSVWHSQAGGEAGLGIDLGDVDQDGVVYKEDTLTADGAKKLFYLSILPIQQITEIMINENPVPITDYCCDLKSGWVSFRDSIPSGSQIIFKYYHSIDMELLLSDYNNSNAHLFRNTNVGITEKDYQHFQPEPMLYPNPIPSGRAIEFCYILPMAQFVQARMYDCSGRKIVTLFGKMEEAGFHRERILAKFQPGIYFLGLEVGRKSITKKIIVVQ